MRLRIRKLYCAHCKKVVKSDEFERGDGAVVVNCSKCKSVLYTRQRMPADYVPGHSQAV